MEGLQAAGRDTELLGRLHGFNDWVQRSLIDLTADIGAAFFRAPPPEQPADPPPLQPAPPKKTSKRRKQTQGQDQSQSQGQKQS